MNMKWTTEKPTKPGWYWYSPPKSPKAFMVCLFVVAGNLAYSAFGQSDAPANRGIPSEGSWYGPLEAPAK